MALRDFQNLTDDELVKISLERGGRYNCYTADAISAQKVLHQRRGGFQREYSAPSKGKVDRSYYSDRYY